ncbi:hypothetical protein C1Y40_01580 [Mycobacterium talmoniae]|uniref:Uncharacterized protein n=1 Tax=Mycobacterium talmoniae TaxID=1858794 RepID=A0A2S8BNE2_9MYCO|nr:hypothetical protein C1Y40_01580 [Mycobacterium talmoniae]
MKPSPSTGMASNSRMVIALIVIPIARPDGADKVRISASTVGIPI